MLKLGNIGLLLIIAIFAIGFRTPAIAIELLPMYSDHMIMQRQHATVISGKAIPNSIISLQVGIINVASGVNKNGDWRLTLPPQPAGGPYNLVFNNGPDKLLIKDMYFGDVWLASGQSNMEWKLKWQVDNWQAEVKDSNYPLIRYFDVENRYTAAEQSTLNSGEWIKASEKTAKEFSAIAWFFAKNLYLDKGIPIAIVDSTWGGTPAEAWTPIEMLLSQSGYQQSAKELLDEPEKWDDIFTLTRKQEVAKSNLLNSQVGANTLGLADLEYDDSNWLQVSLPLDKPVNNILWARKYFDLSKANISATGANLTIGYYSSDTQVYVNGQAISQKSGAQKDDPFWISKDQLNDGKNLLAIRTADAWDNRVNIGNRNQIRLVSNQHSIDLNTGWNINNKLEGELPMPDKYWQKTSVLYNAMIQPIIHYPLKGVIWYQGESNTSRANEYKRLFTAMITSWRERWQQQDLPFIFAQLASMHAQRSEPMESNWALLREAQTQSLSLPHTAMVVLIDAGEAYDIHPRNKQIVGERMWHAANAIAYQKGNIYSGPINTTMSINKNDVVLSFQDIGSGLMIKGDKLVGFELASQDGKFVSADAQIEGKQIVVSAKGIKSPKYVRYAWADNSPANLYNLEGFPAIPFRTDK